MNNKNEHKKIRIVAGFVLLFAALLILLAINICIGSVNIPLKEVLGILFGTSDGETNSVIIMQIRFPRALAAMILGSALALAGYLLQTFFHNPIAGPFVLGISSGAKMMVALTLVFALDIGLKPSSFIMILAAFIGAMLSMGFVLILSKAMDKMAMLIVAGVMIGYICSAITDFVVTFADDSNIVNLHNWSLGSFSGITWENVRVIAIVCMLCFVAVFVMSKPISAYLLGDSYAENMGVNIKLFRIILVLLSSVLSATVTAFAGPISFVGIAVPHLVKRIMKTEKPIIMIPGSIILGGVFCLFADLVSRVMFAPTELSVSTVTAVIGAPIVLYVMVKQRKERA